MTKEEWRTREAQWAKFHQWEEEQQARALPRPPREAFRVFNQLYHEAKTLGVIRPPGRMEDLEAEIRMAEILNAQCRGH